MTMKRKAATEPTMAPIVGPTGAADCVASACAACAAAVAVLGIGSMSAPKAKGMVVVVVGAALEASVTTAEAAAAEVVVAFDVGVGTALAPAPERTMVMRVVRGRVPGVWRSRRGLESSSCASFALRAARRHGQG
ncbi:hypothetical protein GGTG_14094 [Gaeumannomyces tritici R3-111a-1]|uniref:Uncharacterized protein n=1 Tax=Gaeumannomyces tritici (strain R3-111a-1) TaxID=644352 RepID=J3PKN1_GAET3|nr:hypothetical protein GGTG_14094 [Gaeumannomyces tritici R3-111a-1]EJT68328.1 hypothetical protein GGTG_14094 [Gaeumannomyces tritici R3-111a-1]